MNKHFPLFLILLGLVGFSQSCGSDGSGTEASTNPDSTPSAEEQRIVSLSGTITETLFHFGHGEQIVGRDVTSTYPADAVAEIPNLGHVRNLNVEALLGLQPTLILVGEDVKENKAIKNLQDSGIPVVLLPSSNTLDNAITMAEQFPEALRNEERLAQMRVDYQNQRRQLDSLLNDGDDYRPRVLFIYARGKGSMMVGGEETSASSFIELAGGRNAAEGVSGFQALSVEGLVKAQPDAFLLFTSGLASLGGEVGLLEVPGVAQTPAGKERRIITMDGLYALGFTPRATSAAIDLANALNKWKYQTVLSQEKMN
ncbi:MAG: ABC transporter substrate-binding protein [Bacteroidota bacterium]